MELPPETAMAFEIGFVPRGWKRGERLRIVPAKKGGNCCRVWRDTDCSQIFEGEFDPMTIACVTYRAEDVPQVNAWLDWWCGKTANGKLTGGPCPEVE